MSEDRNHTPPKEHGDLINADNIGDTVFSKHWLFTTLMRLIQEVDKQVEGKECQNQDDSDIVDIDDDLQTDLCEIWDMSMSEDVSKLLHEFKTVDLLTGVIAKTRAPRVTEIAIGILGNMACSNNICENMSGNEKFVKLVLLLLHNADSPTLVETTRFLYTCISCSEAKDKWISAIKKNEQVFINIQFILQSSTNTDLLKNVGDFIDKLLDIDEDMCTQWANEELVMAVIEAIKQLGCKPSDSVGTYLHILQLLSTSEKGVESMVVVSEVIIVPLRKFLESICDDEIVAIGGRENWLGSAFSVFSVIFSSVPDGIRLLFSDSRLFRCMLKILEALTLRMSTITPEQTNNDQSQKRIQSITESTEPDETDAKETATSNKNEDSTLTRNKSNSETNGNKEKKGLDSDSKQITSKTEDSDLGKQMLHGVLQGFFEDLFTAMNKETYDIPPVVLIYMDSECKRERILNMTDMLKECSSPLVSELKTMARKFKLNRLFRILERRESTAN